MKKNILVVDDSALMRRVICDIINSTDILQVSDIARDGIEAYDKLKSKVYDAVILDVNMPRMNGLELLEKLQQEQIKANIIMVSTLTTKDATTTILAMERGAIDFVTKPTNIIEAKGEAFKQNLVDVLSAVLRIPKTNSIKMESTRKIVFSTGKIVRKATPANPANKIVALACSTGGPKALQSVIPFLPQNLNAPVVLVQHMPAGFTSSMAKRLNELSKMNVKEAEDGEVLQNGTVYIAPGGKHIQIIKRADGSHAVAYSDIPPIGGLKPCANIMYDSLSKSGYDEIICVVLTGMGADGTNGILTLSQYKPVHVISQDEKSCVVYGMPKAIAETGMVDEVVTLTDVAKTIIKNVGVK